MTITTLKRTPALALLVLLAAGCSIGPPPSCGDEIGGTPDTTAFDQYFNSMTLVSQTTGESGPDSDNGIQFAQGDPLVIQADAKSEVAVRACIQPRSGQAEIPFDQTQTLPQGHGTLPVGAFQPGAFVIRVIVDNTLVRNFAFETK